MQRSIVLIYGQTGSGKTILARALLRIRARANLCPGIVIDTIYEHDDLVPIELDSLQNWLHVNRGKPNLCRVLADPSTDPLLTVFTAVKNESRQDPCPVWIYIDEIYYFSQPNWVAPGLAQMIRTGRHYGISLICVARRGAETARELTAQVTELCIFRQVEPIDLQYFSRILPPAVATKLSLMKNFYYLNYTPDRTYQLCPPVKI